MGTVLLREAVGRRVVFQEPRDTVGPAVEPFLKLLP